MRVETGRLKGPLRVCEELALLGALAGDAVVKRGGVLHLSGIVDGSLVVETGGTAYVRGMVAGDVRNRGGRVEIRGIVVGFAFNEAGETVVHPEAAIHDRAL